MKGNPKQDDPLIQNLHDAGCSQQIIEQFMQSRKEGNKMCIRDRGDPVGHVWFCGPRQL